MKKPRHSPAAPAPVLAFRDRARLAGSIARTQEERARRALHAGGIATWEIVTETGEIIADLGLADLFGVPPDGLTGTMSDFVASIHPVDREAALAAFVQAQHPGGLYEAQFRVLHDNGVIRWLSGVGECFVGSDGRLRMVGYNVDITASKQAEAAREILIDELNHRVKNLFAIAIGMVKMSARAAQTPAEMAESLSGRLVALATAHELIRPCVAEGERREMDGTVFATLLKAVVAPHLSTGKRQLTLRGPKLLVGPMAATHLTLVLHELATNAAKYGALSTPAGRLAVSWRVNGTDVEIVWIERGGPAIVAPPATPGFGSKLMELSIMGQLHGAVCHRWAREGVEITIVAARAQLDR
jgi:two-component sensor histidine kinase